MAEVMEGMPAKGKINSALTTGIIGTSLSGLLMLGATGLLGKKMFNNQNYDTNGVPCGWLYNERRESADVVAATQRFYEGQMDTKSEINHRFFDLYKFNVDTSFEMFRKHSNDAFKMYVMERDDRENLLGKIYDLEKKVDIMAAVRPYQDALIDNKIDKNAMLADFNLARRTCRMIEGQVVIPNKPEVTGYPSYSCGCCNAPIPK